MTVAVSQLLLAVLLTGDFSRETDDTSGLHRQVRSSYQCATSLWNHWAWYLSYSGIVIAMISSTTWGYTDSHNHVFLFPSMYFSVPTEVATRVQVSYQHELGYVDRLHVVTWVSAKYAVLLSLEFTSSHAYRLLESWAQARPKQALHNVSIVLYTCAMVTLNQRHCLLKGQSTVVTTSHSKTCEWAWEGMGCLCTAYTIVLSWFIHPFQLFICICTVIQILNSSVDWVLIWTRALYSTYPVCSLAVVV